MTDKKRVLKVKRIGTNEVVSEVEITGDKSPRQVERVVSGMLRNMSADFYVDDSEAR